jgi:hypothetical protein
VRRASLSSVRACWCLSYLHPAVIAQLSSSAIAAAPRSHTCTCYTSNAGHAAVQHWSCNCPPGSCNRPTLVTQSSNHGHATVQTWSCNCPIAAMQLSSRGSCNRAALVLHRSCLGHVTGQPWSRNCPTMVKQRSCWSKALCGMGCLCCGGRVCEMLALLCDTLCAQLRYKSGGKTWGRTQ